MSDNEADGRAAKKYSANVPVPTRISFNGTERDWKRFKRAWNNYETATLLDKEPEERRVAVFLACIGEEVAELVDGFTFADTESDKVLKDVQKKFEEFFVGVTNEVFEAYKFNIRTQQDGETFDIYLGALRSLVKSCNYGDKEERMIRDRIVIGLKSDDLRQKLLEVQDLSLQKCIDLCRAHESSMTKATDINKPSDSLKVDKIDKRPQSQNSAQPVKTPKTKPCTRCGRKHEPRKCPAYGKRCKNCNKMNHWAAVCNSKPPKVNMVDEDSETDTDDSDHLRFNKIRVDRKSETDTDDNDYLQINKIKCTQRTINDTLLVTTEVHGLDIEFEIDTGSQANILPYKLYKKLKNKHPLEKTKKKLTSFTGHKLQVLGETKATVMGKVIPFYVVKPTRNLKTGSILGFKASTDLKIIQVLVASLKLDSENIEKQFPDQFGTLGCLGEPYKLKLDPSVEPKIDGMRKIPFALKNRKVLQNGLVPWSL